MQEKKNKRRFVLLVVLVVATLLVFWWVQPENRIRVDQNAFQVEDLKSITKVELVSGSDSVTLLFDGARWEVNGQSDADGNMINVLFATLQQARPRRMVGRANRDSIYHQLETSGVKVLLYDAGELKKAFFAGGNASKTQAYFADPSSKDVYVMAIPGYRVYVSGIFELKESGWWNKLAFDLNWVNFKGLTAKFPKNPADNFTVSLNRDHFAIEGLAETDTARLNTYLDDVSLLTVDEYVSAPGVKDSLAKREPFVEIAVTDMGNRNYRLRLFVPEPPFPAKGIIQDSRVAIFSRRKIQPLLKPRSYFSKK
ncbi:MAG TPA: DUF4340 domain-containing protein [Chryseosolibacter sp.]